MFLLSTSDLSLDRAKTRCARQIWRWPTIQSNGANLPHLGQGTIYQLNLLLSASPAEAAQGYKRIDI